MDTAQKDKSTPNTALIEAWIGNILKVGVAISAGLISLGGILYLNKYGLTGPGYATFKGEPEQLKDIHGILTSALSFHSRGIIQLGLLCLIATPIMRVLFSLGIYIKQKDALYCLITSIVLGLLTYSLMYIK